MANTGRMADSHGWLDEATKALFGHAKVDGSW